MTISTLAELKATIADHLHRTDLTNSIPDFIRLAESKLSREILSQSVEATADLVTVPGQNYVLLPERYAKAITLKLEYGNGTYVFLEKLATPRIDFQQQFTGRPAYYRIGVDRIEFNCLAQEAYNLVLRYFKALDLNADGTNTILTRHPDAYLYTSLVEGFRYLRDFDTAQYYGALAGAVIDEIKQHEIRDYAEALAITDYATAESFNVFAG